jgi:integrase
MKDLRKIIGIDDITFYWARHTFANTARNACRMSKDDVALALNHVDEGHRTTDIYISKDWKIVDEVQEKVVRLLG